ncbi:aminopeptidase P N-terminal domain-containing protein [Polaromonas sp.]|nr:aminopeptidase P N-terminal domain-containing protein [Candidatus Saccharibacteria bacterium]
MNTAPTSFFESEFFTSNRRRLIEKVSGTGPMVITANGLLQRGGDSSYAFCQDANFWYLTGIDEPDITLVIDGDEEYLVVPPRDASRTAFDGVLDDDTFINRSGIKTILETEAGWERLSKALNDAGSVQTIAAPPAYIERYGLYANPARARLIKQLKKASEGITIQDIATHIVHLRMIKQPPELQAIQQAINITLATIKGATAANKLMRYTHEYQLEAEISKGFRARGARGHSFDPIVAGGERACTLHNVANNQALSPGELVVVDVGAEVEHYAADITRTVCIGEPTKRQRAVHTAVADVQQYAYNLLKPGVLLADYEKQVETYMGETLKKLGLIIEATHTNIRHYYPHATSHYLGLNVHDAGDYDLPLQPGMVITVEPGIYIPEEGIGVRIEDDVLITKRGIKVLSKRLTGQLA